MRIPSSNPRLGRPRGLLGIGISLLLVAAATFAMAPTASGAPIPDGYGIWKTTDVPKATAAADTAAVELGLQFSSSQNGWIKAVRYFKTDAAAGSVNGTLWSSAGQVLARAGFDSQSGSGWKTAIFTTPVAVTAGRTYVASYTAPKGRYAADQQTLGAGQRRTSGALTGLAGVFNYSLGYPASTWNNTNYYADVIFSTSTAASTPTTTSRPTAITTTARPTTSSSAPRPTTSGPTITSPSSTRPTTTTTSAAPSTGMNCATKPSACGFPDASNSGVPAGTTLRSVPGQLTSGPGWHYDSRGWIAVDGDGAVLDAITTTASIDVTANNVTIKNSRLTVKGETWAIATRHTTNVTIQSNDITAPARTGSSRLMVGIKDIYGDSANLKVIDNDISFTSTGVQIESGTIQDNFIHDLGYLAGDHLNGITSNGGSTALLIKHNTVLNDYQQTDAISLFQDFGAQRNRTIDNNLIAGGGYTLYSGANPGKESTATGIKVTNNRFSRIYFANSGYYGPSTAYTSAGGNIWSGNIWDDTGKTVSP